ncbi:MAG TPA: hypothetical protein GX700_13095 [Paracoccus sp.]|nr:hypothetical protein [Paracoccus sp. (in: a-proteobacteria)]
MTSRKHIHARQARAGGAGSAFEGACNAIAVAFPVARRPIPLHIAGIAL